MRTRPQIEQDIVRTLRTFRAADEPRRLALRTKLAEAIIELREHFITPEGRPDWTGRTGTYRLAVRDLYSDAGYSKEEAAPLQKAVQYHVGNLVREKLTDREREDVGLGAISPKEQAAKTRADRSALVRAARELLNQPATKGRPR